MFLDLATHPVSIWEDQAQPIVVYQISDMAARSKSATGASSSGCLFVTSASLLTVDLQDQRLIVGLGQAVWIPPDCPYAVTMHGAFSGWLCLAGPNISRTISDKPAVLVSTPLLRELASWLARADNDPRTERARCLAASLLVEEMIATDVIGCRLPLPTTGPIATAAAILQRNPRATLDGLAQSVGLSKRTLTRRFQRETGLSVKAWLGRFQMYRARALLSEGRTVTEAAMEVGYDSLSAFITRFRRLTGETPMDFVRATLAGS